MKQSIFKGTKCQTIILSGSSPELYTKEAVKYAHTSLLLNSIPFTFRDFLQVNSIPCNLFSSVCWLHKVQQMYIHFATVEQEKIHTFVQSKINIPSRNKDQHSWGHIKSEFIVRRTKVRKLKVLHYTPVLYASHTSL
jgi:hypothetical protein